MIYNNDIKKWEHAGGVGGLSRCHIYFNPGTITYRIVGRKLNDNDVSIVWFSLYRVILFFIRNLRNI